MRRLVATRRWAAPLLQLNAWASPLHHTTMASIGVPVLATMAIVALMSCMPTGEKPILLEVVDYGIIESDRVTMRPDETSSVGAKRANSLSMRIAVTTTRIPLRPGLSYGLAFRVTEAPSQESEHKSCPANIRPVRIEGHGQRCLSQ